MDNYLYPKWERIDALGKKFISQGEIRDGAGTLRHLSTAFSPIQGEANMRGYYLII